jgi:hypothetical protein
MLTVMKASNKCIKGIITILKVKSNKELINLINLVCLVLNWSIFLSSFMSINLKLTNIPLNKRKQISCICLPEIKEDS